MTLDNLSQLFFQQFCADGSRGALESEQAISLPSKNNRNRAGYLANYANALAGNYQAFHNQIHLDQVDSLEEAVDLTDNSDDIHLATILSKLGDLLRLRYEAQGGHGRFESIRR